MDNPSLTLDEFRNKIKDYLTKSLSHLSPLQLDDYISSSNDYICTMYMRAIERYESGESNHKQMTIGAPSAVAACLGMMY